MAKVTSSPGTVGMKNGAGLSGFTGSFGLLRSWNYNLNVTKPHTA